MNRYPPDPNGDIPPAYRITAAYQATGMTDEFVVPALKALFLGFFGGMTIGILVGWAHGHGWLMRINAPLAGLVTGLGLTGWLFFRFSERAHWMIERIAGLDLNMDGYVGQPQVIEAPPPLRVVLEQDQGRQVEYIDLPHRDKLPYLASGLAEGTRTFSLDSCNHVLSRKEFGELRDEMLRRGLARWKNPNAANRGLELTPAGRAIFRRIENYGHVAPKEDE